MGYHQKVLELNRELLKVSSLGKRRTNCNGVALSEASAIDFSMCFFLLASSTYRVPGVDVLQRT